MKKVARGILLCMGLLGFSIAVHFFVHDGIPLPDTPKTENVEQVIVVHHDYPNDTKEYSDEFHIKIAVALIGYLDHNPLKKLSKELPEASPVIQITYSMKDGTEVVILANDDTVWWKDKTYAIHNEGEFVKMCTATFYLQN